MVISLEPNSVDSPPQPKEKALRVSVKSRRWLRLVVLAAFVFSGYWLSGIWRAKPASATILRTAEIDTRPFEVQFAHAERQLDPNRTQLDNAKIDLARYKLLYRTEPSSLAKGQKTGKGKKKRDQGQTREVDVGADTPVLWQDTGTIERRDLFYGPGGQVGAPDPAGKFTYVRNQPTGTQKKIIVKDDQDRTWTVKFGPEARSETVASRIVWAVGYYAHQDYFIKEAHINGYSEPVIHDVRFQRRDDGYKSIGNWSWESNPFVGTCELDGLEVLITP